MKNLLLRSALIAALLIFFCVAFPVAQAAPGDLDPAFAGFGTGGIVVETGLAMAIYFDASLDMVVQPDGKIVTVGHKEANLVLFRYLSNGQRDATFGNGGKVEIIPPTANLALLANAIAVQSDGKIVVTGRTTVGASPAYYTSDFLLVRLTAAGQLDSTFGQGGIVTTDFFGHRDSAEALLIQPDGKIVVCGIVNTDGDNDDFGVARYRPDGSLDPSFSGNGKVNIGFGDKESCYSLTIQNDGRLILAGEKSGFPLFGLPYSDFAMARLTPNGSLDSSFDGDGKLSLSLGDRDEARDVALQPDGKIVLLGGDFFENHKGHLARLLPDGKLDGTFGSGGKLTIPNDRLFALALQPDGKLLGLGYHKSPDGDYKFALHRRLADGSPDTTFNNDGIALLDFGGQDVGRGLSLLPDGRILALGRSGLSKMILLQLWPDGTYDSGGQQIHRLNSVAPGAQISANSLTLQSDGYFLTAGRVAGTTSSQAIVTRFKPNGLPETTFGTNGSAYVGPGPGIFNDIYAVVTQPDGKVVVAGYSWYDAQRADFLVARFNSDGHFDNSFGDAGIFEGDFAGGRDVALALALAPDGKIVVAGYAMMNAHLVPALMRLTSSGQLDNSFDGDGKTYVNFDSSSEASAVVVRPDGTIIIGGSYGGNFFLQSLRPDGQPDAGFGGNPSGYTITDLGGTETLKALGRASDGRLYAAGYRLKDNNYDIVLTQYAPDGIRASCVDPQNCQNWPDGIFLGNVSNLDFVYALDLRSDNHVVAAGCINQHFAAVQVNTNGVPTPIYFNTNLVGENDCARAVKFQGPNTMLLAGAQQMSPMNSDNNIGLARFETTLNPLEPTPTPTIPSTYDPPPTPSATPNPSPTGYRQYLPVILR